MVHCVNRGDACERPRIGGWRWRQVLGLWRMQCTRHRDQRARVQWGERALCEPRLLGLVVVEPERVQIADRPMMGCCRQAQRDRAWYRAATRLDLTRTATRLDLTRTATPRACIQSACWVDDVGEEEPEYHIVHEAVRLWQSAGHRLIDHVTRQRAHRVRAVELDDEALKVGQYLTCDGWRDGCGCEFRLEWGGRGSATRDGRGLSRPVPDVMGEGE